MTTITKQQLQQLQKLAALDLSPEEQEKLLPQLETILWMVEKVQEYHESLDHDHVPTHTMQPNESIHDGFTADDLLQNVNHPVHDAMITLETSTNE